MLERRIGDFMAAIFLLRGFSWFLESIRPVGNVLAAFLYNRNVHDKMHLQADLLPWLEQMNIVLNGLALFGAAALVYWWTHKPQLQVAKQRKADG